jgi:hypothetical protein
VDPVVAQAEEPAAAQTEALAEEPRA